MLLLLLKESRDALALCESTYSGAEYAPLLRRFYTDDKPRYRVYFTVATLCALLRDDLSERSTDTDKDQETRFVIFMQRTEPHASAAAEWPGRAPIMRLQIAH